MQDGHKSTTMSSRHTVAPNSKSQDTCMTAHNQHQYTSSPLILNICLSDLPAHIWEASTLFIPVCKFAVPVDGPRGDAQVPFPSDGCAGIGSITAPEGINDPSLLGGEPSCTHPDDLLDVLTAVESCHHA